MRLASPVLASKQHLKSYTYRNCSEGGAEAADAPFMCHQQLTYRGAYACQTQTVAVSKLVAERIDYSESSQLDGVCFYTPHQTNELCS